MVTTRKRVFRVVRKTEEPGVQKRYSDTRILDTFHHDSLALHAHQRQARLQARSSSAAWRLGASWASDTSSGWRTSVVASAQVCQARARLGRLLHAYVEMRPLAAASEAHSSSTTACNSL